LGPVSINMLPKFFAAIIFQFFYYNWCLLCSYLDGNRLLENIAY
jgi:hypothetical protein